MLDAADVAEKAMRHDLPSPKTFYLDEMARLWHERYGTVIEGEPPGRSVERILADDVRHEWHRHDDGKATR